MNALEDLGKDILQYSSLQINTKIHEIISNLNNKKENVEKLEKIQKSIQEDDSKSRLVKIFIEFLQNTNIKLDDIAGKIKELTLIDHEDLDIVSRDFYRFYQNSKPYFYHHLF